MKLEDMSNKLLLDWVKSQVIPKRKAEAPKVALGFTIIEERLKVLDYLPQVRSE